MRRISHQTLYWITIVTALVGQFQLDSSPRFAILLCGIALTANLLNGWWYPVPIGSSWWYPALIGAVGLTMWNEPRGWFFMAWAMVMIGTGLRARSLWLSHNRRLAEERARVERLESMGFEPQTDLPQELRPEVTCAPAPLPPIPVWRYPVAILMGGVAAWFGAWCTMLYFRITNWQLDILAYFVGYLVGKAVTAGAGDRTNGFLRVLSATLGGAGVLYGRYLLVRYLAFDQFHKASTVQGVVSVALRAQAAAAWLWLVLFVTLGAWTGWHYSKVVRRAEEIPAGSN